MHGGGVAENGRASGAPAGNINAEIHGHYGAAATTARSEMRRLVRTLRRAMKGAPS